MKVNVPAGANEAGFLILDTVNIKFVLEAYAVFGKITFKIEPTNWQPRVAELGDVKRQLVVVGRVIEDGKVIKTKLKG